MTPVFCCGFECGVVGSGTHWAGGLPSGGSFSTGTVRNGLRSFNHVNPTTGGSVLSMPSAMSGINTAGVHAGVVRVYVRFSVLPTSDTMIAAMRGSEFHGVGFKSSDSKLYTAYRVSGTNPTFGASGVTVTTGQWYQIDFKVDPTANPWTIDAQVDGVALAQLTHAVTAQNNLLIGVGFEANAAVTGNVFFDDVIMSITAADYPIGEGKVIGYVPNADGTHTSTSTNIVKGTIAAPTGGGAITAATTDAFNWVNGRPLLGGATDNTRLINHQTNAATQYVEVAFEDSVEDRAPRAVEVLTAERQAATTSGDMAIKLSDNGSESGIVTRSGAAGVTSDRFTRIHFATPPSGGSWNLNASGNGSFQNIRARFGYSGDATPDQYWRGVMIEAEYDTAPLPTLIPRMALMGVG